MFSNEVSTEAKSLKRRCLTCRSVLERLEACRWMTFYDQTVLLQIVLNRGNTGCIACSGRYLVSPVNMYHYAQSYLELALLSFRFHSL